MRENVRMPKRVIALRYQPEQELAPRVIAKGSGDIARQIIERAVEHGIPLQEDPTLVQLLSKIELEHQIPPELYRVVAEVLSFVYRMELRAKEQSNDI